MRNFMIFLAIVLLCGCKDSNNDSISNAMDYKDALKAQGWAFSKRYVRAINDTSWEQMMVTPLNDYEDFKIDFTLISTGKPQNCTLYSKGILINSVIHAQKSMKNKKKILFRPNVIANTTITFIQNENDKNALNVEISNLQDFLKTCGIAHTHANGEYKISN